MAMAGLKFSFILFCFCLTSLLDVHLCQIVTETEISFVEDQTTPFPGEIVDENLEQTTTSTTSTTSTTTSTTTTSTTTSTTTPPPPTTTTTAAAAPSPVPLVAAASTTNLLKNVNVSENLIFQRLEDLNDLKAFNPATWVAPDAIKKEYPFFLSGFDDEDRPIWIAQWGHMDMRKIILQKQEEVFEKYVQQAAYVIIKSHDIRSTPEHPVHSASFLLDFDGLKLEQIASVPTVSFCLKLARMTQPLLDKYTDKIVVVNANYLTELLMNIARPILGGIFGRMEVHGTNRARWLPHVQKAYPKDQLPEYYGGFKNPNFKPLIVQG